MKNIFRSLSFNIVQAVYPLIPDLYGVFQDLASNRYFTQDAIRTLSGNIYIIMSACMLFALGIKLLSSIVNPEMLTDQKKGAKSVALHVIFAVFLIALIPRGFNLLYVFQEDIISKQLVEKIVLGMDTSEKSKPGQILAAYGFASFCEPHETVSSQAISSQGSDLYNKAVTEDISYIKQMDGVINSKTNGEYDLEYNEIIAPAVGIYLVYELILLCMDIALRTIKLGMLELITPVILCGYVIAGTEILQKWAKMVFSTFVLVFLKIAMVTFMIYGLSLLPDFLNNFSDKGFWYRGFLRIFMIIGLLQLIKQVPDIINGIFGTNLKSRGGIRGRLGEMAAVGALAQRGWDQLRQHPIQTARSLVSAPLSAVGGAISHSAAAINRGRDVGERIRANGGSRGAQIRGMIGTAAGGILTSAGAAYRAGRSGWQNGNLQGIGEQAHRYSDTHPVNSTFAGRMQDTALQALGLRTRQEQQEQRDQLVPVPMRDAQGRVMRDNNGNVMTRRATFEELQARQSVDKAFDEARSSIRSQIETSIDREHSSVEMNFEVNGRQYSGNAASIRQQIEALSNSTAEELGFKDKLDSNGNMITAGEQKANFISELNHAYVETRSNLLDAAENAVWAGGNKANEFTAKDYNGNEITYTGDVLCTGADKAIVDNVLNHVTDLVNNNANLQTTITNEINGHVSAIGTGTDQNGNAQIRITDFRDGGRNAVTSDYNEINRAVSQHDDQIAARQGTAQGRERVASSTAVQARNNNGGNNSGGNRH